MIDRFPLRKFFLLWVAAALCAMAAEAGAPAAGPDLRGSARARALPGSVGPSVPPRPIDLAVRPGGPSGLPILDEDEPFSPERAEALVRRIETMEYGSTPVRDRAAMDRALALLPGFQKDLSRFVIRELPDEDAAALRRRTTELENLEGIALKGRHRPAMHRPPFPTPMPPGVEPSSNPADLRFAPLKVNTGWILDQHLFDPDAAVYYPTINDDYRSYDEGRSDIAIGHSDHPSSSTMFGWVWQVQSFYWTEIAADHPNPSYSLMIMVSPDGGATWWLYTILYDPSDTVSRDLVNPKLAIDITGAFDRLYIAYEWCYDSTDHDVYVFSDVSVMDGGTSSPADAAIAATTAWEGNPTIAADYKTGETSYRVVAYEVAASASNHDLYASQSTGDGSVWSTAAAVASTPSMETNPALSPGCSGPSNLAYMHLAYNCDTRGSAASQILLNAGFESGDDGAWLWSSSGGYDIIDGTSPPAPRTGTWKAWFGGYHNAADTLYQSVAIPADAISASFSFYLWIDSDDSTTTPYDYLYAEVRDADHLPPAAPIATLATYSNVNYGTAYVLRSFDLTAYAGTTIYLYFRATTDSADITNFLVDDTALNISQPQLTASEIRYARAQHPGTTPYPDGLAAFAKIAALASSGTTPAWPYGPPAIAASHGGSASIATGRVLVAADRLFPQDQPNPGDRARYQLAYAVNMCNGGTGCGSIACSPALSLDWNAYYFYDNRTDYRFPALVVDGVGWVEGTSGIPQNGVDQWWEMFMAYYTRPLASSLDFGDVEMLVTFANDERCSGFQSNNSWYIFTASEIASDGDGRVVAKQGTLAAFNYFYGWPGVGFNKRLNHMGFGLNDDIYFTTPGDNYTIDTLHEGVHILSHFAFYGENYLGPWTFAWPAGFQFSVTAALDTVDNDRYYSFSQWDTGHVSAELPVLTAYYTPVGQYCPYGEGLCQGTSINALYGGGCLVTLPEVTDVRAVRSGIYPRLAWTAPGAPGDVGSYTVLRATDPGAAGNFGSVGTSISATFEDTTASGNLYFYIISAGCGPYSGPWGHYGQ